MSKIKKKNGKLKHWSDKDIIDYSKRLFEENGPMTKYEFKQLCCEKDLFTYETVRRRFRSLDLFALKAEIRFKKFVPYYSEWNKEKILNTIKEIYRASGKSSLSCSYIQKYIDGGRICSFYKIRKEFNTVKNMLDVAGIKHYDSKRKWNKENIIFCFKKIFLEKGPIKISEVPFYCKKKRICSPATVGRFFGSFKNLEKESGLKFSKKRKVQWSRESIINAIRDIFDKEGRIGKIDIKNVYSKQKGDKNKRRICDYTYIQHVFGSLDELAKEAGIKFRRRKRSWILGNNETKILDDIEKEKGIFLDRQFRVGKYMVDGYDTFNNVVYEVDEIGHRYRQIEDSIRDDRIRSVLGCDVVRIKDGW